MNRVQQLRNAVTGRDREVEVQEDGTVREVEKGNGTPAAQKTSDKPKATKLAARTFGAV